MSADEDGESFPRSMRHRQILDAAEDHPDASIDELASMVPSATPKLVEHVFEEHGDPASETAPEPPDESAPTGPAAGADDPGEADGANEATNGVESAESEGDDTQDHEETDDETADQATTPDPEELSDRQRELLEVVAVNPEATQDEIAERFGVTRATISRWAGEIEGFDWREREAFVEAVLPEVPAPTTDGGSTPADTAENPPETTGVEDSSAAGQDTGVEVPGSDSKESAVFDDPELVHKIAHACLESDAISEDEELQILKGLLQ